MSKPEKTMTDSMGNTVPIRYVNKYDRARDASVRRILARWKKGREALEKIMQESLADLDKLAVLRGEETGQELTEKGNFQVSSFDGHITVSINVRYDIILDERVIRAREMMLEYVRGLVAKVGGDDGQILLELINAAFQANAAGQLSQARVLSLINRNIRAAKWQEAVKLLQDSIETRRGKSYLSVTVRPSRQHDPEPVRLDIADCWPKPTPEKGA